MQAGGAVDALAGHARRFGKAGAQNVMALDELLQGPFQRRCVEVAADAQGAGQVVRRALRRELLQQPEPLLGEGQLRRPTIDDAPDATPGVARVSHQQGQQVVVKGLIQWGHDRSRRRERSKYAVSERRRISARI
ncbi:hypothetical protein D3C84_556840 [compost metagenome]